MANGKKLVLRSFIERKIKGVEIIAINELGPLESSFHLLKYDSSHGILNEKFTCDRRVWIYWFQLYSTPL